MVQQPYPPQQPSQSNPLNTFLLIGCFGGIAVLVILLAFGGYKYIQMQKEGHHEAVQPAPTIQAPVATPAPATEPQETTSAPQTDAPPPVRSKPGPEAAMDKALDNRPGWTGKVTYSSDDWQRVKAVIGPSGKQTETVVLQWDGSADAYVVESATPIVVTRTVVEEPKPEAKPKPKPKPRTNRTRRWNPAWEGTGVNRGPVTPEPTGGYDGNR